MSLSSAAASSSARPVAADAGSLADAAQAGRYLTDGVSLLRCLGMVAGGMGQMVKLEDCHSLEVVLLPIGDLQARRLRTVLPVDGR